MGQYQVLNKQATYVALSPISQRLKKVAQWMLSRHLAEQPRQSDHTLLNLLMHPEQVAVALEASVTASLAWEDLKGCRLSK